MESLTQTKELKTYQNSEIVTGNHGVPIFNPFDGGGRGSSRLTFEHYVRSLMCIGVGWSLLKLWRNCREKELLVNQWLINKKLIGVCREVTGKIHGWLFEHQSSTCCESTYFHIHVVTKYLNLQQMLEVWLERVQSQYLLIVKKKK